MAATAVILFGGGAPVQAACEPPMISVDRLQASPGDVIEVTGQAWISGCEDTGGSQGGCGWFSDPEDPMSGIEVRLKGPKTHQTQEQLDVGDIGDTEIDIELDTVDANTEGRFTTAVTIPDVPPGVYFLTAEEDLSAYQPPEIAIHHGSGESDLGSTGR